MFSRKKKMIVVQKKVTITMIESVEKSFMMIIIMMQVIIIPAMVRVVAKAKTSMLKLKVIVNSLIKRIKHPC